MFDREDHAADRSVVGLNHRRADLLQAQGLDGADLVLMAADGALDERNFKLHFNAPSLAQQFFNGLAAQARDLFDGLKTAQALERRLDDVDGVVGAVRLGDDIADTGSLNDRTRGTAGDNTGALGSGLSTTEPVPNLPITS